MTRMVRFLTDESDTQFGGANQSILLKPISNHFPILLEGASNLIGGPLPIRFENM